MLHNHLQSDELTSGELLLSYIKYEDPLFAFQSGFEILKLAFQIVHFAARLISAKRIFDYVCPLNRVCSK